MGKLSQAFGAAAKNAGPSQADLGNLGILFNPLDPGKKIDLVGDKGDSFARSNNFNSFEDFVVQTLFGGLFGVGDSGDIEGGPILKGYDEAIGEVSGRNARRGELNRQQGLLDEEQATRDRLEAEGRLADEQADRAASLAGGPGDAGPFSSRSSRSSSSRSGSGFKLGEQRDFLGL